MHKGMINPPIIRQIPQDQSQINIPGPALWGNPKEPVNHHRENNTGQQRDTHISWLKMCCPPFKRRNVPVIKLLRKTGKRSSHLQVIKHQAAMQRYNPPKTALTQVQNNRPGSRYDPAVNQDIDFRVCQSGLTANCEEQIDDCIKKGVHCFIFTSTQNPPPSHPPNSHPQTP